MSAKPPRTMPPKRAPCKYFSSGMCYKGEDCKFSHDEAAPANICKFYQKGKCSYGSRCKYVHVKASQFQSSASSSSGNSHQGSASRYVPVASSAPTMSNKGNMNPKAPIQLSALSKAAHDQRSEVHVTPVNVDANGLENMSSADHILCLSAADQCPRGDKCPYIHGDLCAHCEKHCLHPSRPDQREEHMKTCQSKQKQLEMLKLSEEIECGVCLDRVLSKTKPEERKFGLLSECDHPFCISCIRNWRSSSSAASGVNVNNKVKACPVCRKVSYFVVPSDTWYSTKEEKQEIIDKYQEKLSSIDCKHFNFGNGNCPFGTRCFYKHTVRPGSYTWIHNRPPPRRPRRHSPQENLGDLESMIDFFGRLLLSEELMEEEDYLDMDPEDFQLRGLEPWQREFFYSQVYDNMSDLDDYDDYADFDYEHFVGMGGMGLEYDSDEELL